MLRARGSDSDWCRSRWSGRAEWLAERATWGTLAADLCTRSRPASPGWHSSFKTGWRIKDADEVTAVEHFELPMPGRPVQIQTQFLTAMV